MAYKYRIYPTAEQAAQIERTFGCVRYVYNAMLDRQKKVYERRKEHLSYKDMQNLLPGIKLYLPWLGDVDSQALQQACRQLDAAYKRFFDKQERFREGMERVRDRRDAQNEAAGGVQARGSQRP